MGQYITYFIRLRFLRHSLSRIKRFAFYYFGLLFRRLYCVALFSLSLSRFTSLAMQIRWTKTGCYLSLLFPVPLSLSVFKPNLMHFQHFAIPFMNWRLNNVVCVFRLRGFLFRFAGFLLCSVPRISMFCSICGPNKTTLLLTNIKSEKTQTCQRKNASN